MGMLVEGEERERLREALLEYCRLDTLAMVRIVEALARIAATPETEGD